VPVSLAFSPIKPNLYSSSWTVHANETLFPIPVLTTLPNMLTFYRILWMSYTNKTILLPLILLALPLTYPNSRSVLHKEHIDGQCPWGPHHSKISGEAIISRGVFGSKNIGSMLLMPTLILRVLGRCISIFCNHVYNSWIEAPGVCLFVKNFDQYGIPRCVLQSIPIWVDASGVRFVINNV
jgi:hypothetical protein